MDATRLWICRLEEMNITIVSTGRVATALGEGWSRAGHSITYAVRNLESEKVRELREKSGVQVRAMEGAAADADVVVLAVPAAAALDAASALGDLGSAIIVDPTNPLTPERTLDPSQSAAPRLAELYPDNPVVKAFNTTGSANMRDPVYPDGPLTMPICGDDPEAKKVVVRLAVDIGFEPLDCGRLERTSLLENLALFWITMAYAEGTGADFGMRVVYRTSGPE